MFNKLKQIKDLTKQANIIKATLAEEIVEGSAAWGKITIKMDGTQKIHEVNIDPELLSPDKKSKVEAGVKDALSDCLKKIQKVMVKKMQSSGVDLNLPGM